VAKIRILDVVSGFGLGGAEKALLARIKYMPVEFDQNILNVRPEIDALELSSVIIEHKIIRRGLFRFIEIVQFLKYNKSDLVIVRTPLDAVRFGLIRIFMPRILPRLLFEAHSNFVSKKNIVNFLLSALLRMVSWKFDLVIAVSENVRRGPLCREQKNVEVVYLGADLDLPTLRLREIQNPQLLFIGRLVEVKRPLWLLERFSNIRSKVELPASALTIVGAGPLEDQVKRFINTDNLETVVDYVGLQLDVSPYLLSATHLVSSSTNEGLPLTFFEAKLAGLSILATPSGGGSEIFDSTDHELTSFETDEFEIALIKIFQTAPPTLEVRQGMQNRSSWMTTEQCAKRYYVLLNDLISK
jgi:glycosyltransferase involved in cell wall biosynthesis